MRGGRPEDLPALLELCADEVRREVRDCVPAEGYLHREMAGFDWGARMRVVEGEGGVAAAVLVTVRDGAVGPVARIEVASLDGVGQDELIRWGLGLSRAGGARKAQVWRARHLDPEGEALAGHGLRPVRRFWRMDRLDLEGLAAAPLAAGYTLAGRPEWRRLAAAYNLAFAEHWRHRPLDPDCPPPGERVPELDLLALDPAGRPAAVVWCELESHEPDPRPQPVGLVGVVGTVPGHRRQGLALALTAEALRRLRERGARSASLYVDAQNPTRAADLYSRLGFEVGFEFQVYEADL